MEQVTFFDLCAMITYDPWVIEQSIPYEASVCVTEANEGQEDSWL